MANWDGTPNIFTICNLPYLFICPLAPLQQGLETALGPSLHQQSQRKEEGEVSPEETPFPGFSAKRVALANDEPLLSTDFGRKKSGFHLLTPPRISL